METSLSGFSQVAGQDILVESSVATQNIGAYMESADGRGFRYAKVGDTSTVAGKVYQGPARDATNQTPSGGLAVAAADIGAFEVVTTATVTLAKDLLAGGYLSVVVTPGQGYTYRIKGNTEASGVAVTFTLEDPIQIALTTSSNIIVAKHPYDGIVIEPGTPTARIAGVPTSIITNAFFGWIQTKGTCAVLFTGTGVAGSGIGSLVGGTSGSMAPAIEATGRGGEHLALGITGEYSLVYLTID